MMMVSYIMSQHEQSTKRGSLAQDGNETEGQTPIHFKDVENDSQYYSER